MVERCVANADMGVQFFSPACEINNMTKQEKKDKEFKESQKRLRQVLRERFGDKIIEVTIPFRNDDLPKFLRRLEEFEEESAKSKLMIGY